MEPALQLDLLRSAGKNTVVILGSRFFKEEIIEKIGSRLVERGYAPMIAFKMTQELDDHFTPRQRMCWFLANAKFVLAEDSVPSGEMLELEYCRNISVTTAVLHDKNLPRSSWMSLDIDIHAADFKCFSYEKEKIEKIVEDAVDWAERRNKEKKSDFLDRQNEWAERNHVFEEPAIKAAIETIKNKL